MALELVKDKDSKETFNEEECEVLLRGVVSTRLLEQGLICRADDKGDPVIQLSPPLITTRAQIDDMVDVLDRVVTEVDHRFHSRARHLRAMPAASSPAQTAVLAANDL